MIKILFTGDFCPIGEIDKLSKRKEYHKIYNDFYEKLMKNDFRVTNLECPLVDEICEKNKFGPSLKASKHTIKVLKYGKFDLVTLANNHIMDQGNKGLKSTIKLCKKYNIEIVGAGNNLKEASTPYIIDIKGIRFGFINIAENEFSNTHGNEAGANPLSLVDNFNQIIELKNKTDKIIVIYHGGNENYNLPSPRLKKTFRFFIDVGADAVLAHHTHCVSGYESYRDKPIFYGIGNFIFDYNINNEEWCSGIAVQLIFDQGKIDFNVIPFYQNKDKINGIQLIKGKEKKYFEKKLGDLNKIIVNDELLEKRFFEFIKFKERQYAHFLEPYENKILHGLFGKKIIPSFLSKNKRNLYLNLIRCESHRDVLLKILKK